MVEFNDVENRICRALDVLRTTQVIEDEKTKTLLFETVADMLRTTADMLKPAKPVEVEDDE